MSETDSEVRRIARAKLAKARQFMFIAEAVDGSHHDVVVSLSAISAINAADAILLLTTSTYSHDSDHHGAVRRLKEAGREHASRSLRTALIAKGKAQYQPRCCTIGEARKALLSAKRLLNAAEELNQEGGVTE